MHAPNSYAIFYLCRYLDCICLCSLSVHGALFIWHGSATFYFFDTWKTLLKQVGYNCFLKHDSTLRLYNTTHSIIGRSCSQNSLYGHGWVMVTWDSHGDIPPTLMLGLPWPEPSLWQRPIWPTWHSTLTHDTLWPYATSAANLNLIGWTVLWDTRIADVHIFT